MVRRISKCVCQRTRDLWEEITGHSGQRISDGYGHSVSNAKKLNALSSALSCLVDR